MGFQGAFPLPHERHVPGANARPEEGAVFAAAAEARRADAPGAWSECASYLYGFDLLVGGFFWEAHEVWEPVWANCPPNSRERAVLRGLIQCANAGLKSVMARPGAAGKLLVLAAACFDEARSRSASDCRVMGLLPGAAAAACRSMQAMGDPALPLSEAIRCCPEFRPNMKYNASSGG